MARDRKKAKARRARQERQAGGRAAGGKGAGSSRPARQHEGERGSPADPLEHASGDAELAKEAELGLPVDDVDEPGPGDDKARVYEDELTDDAAGQGVLAELVDRDEDLGIEEDDDPELVEQAEAAGGRGDGGSGKAAAASATGRPPRQPREKREGNRVFAFLRACWAELQRVQWPDRRAVAQATAVVLGFVIIAGSYLGLMDFVWSKLVSALLDL